MIMQFFKFMGYCAGLLRLLRNERLAASISPLADYYKQQGVLLALYYNESEVYSDVQTIDSEMLNFEKTQSKNVTEKTVNGTTYITYVPSLDGLASIDPKYSAPWETGLVEHLRTNHT